MAEDDDDVVPPTQADPRRGKPSAGRRAVAPGLGDASGAFCFGAAKAAADAAAAEAAAADAAAVRAAAVR